MMPGGYSEQIAYAEDEMRNEECSVGTAAL
jgi:hypothetical protein